MRSFGQFIFNLCMLFKFDSKQFHLLFHLLILECELFNMLRLVVEFTAQLNVLLNSEFCSTLKLVFIHRQHLNLNISDTKEHFFPKFFDFLVSLFLNLLDVLFVPRIFNIKSILQISYLSLLLFLILEPIFNIIPFFLLLRYFPVLILNLEYKLSVEVSDLLLVDFVTVLDFLHKV